MDRLDGDAPQARIQAGMEDDDNIGPLLLQVWDGATAVGPSHPLQVLRQELKILKAKQAMTEQVLAAQYLGRP